MALVGVHPVFTQVPPNNLRSTNATFMPEFASRFASGGPAWPAPTTIASNLVAMRCTFHEFKEHAAGALRMNKNIAMATSPDFDFFRDEPRSIFFQLGDSGRQIGNAKAHVVKAFSPLSNKLCDGGVIGGCFEQFETAFADRHHHELYFFLLDGFLRRDFET